jgi:hypothetical protein
MRLPARLHLIASVVFLVLMLTAGLSLAAGGGNPHGPKATEPAACESTEGTPTDGTPTEGAPTDEADDESEEADESQDADDECAADVESESEAEAPESAPVEDPEREAACNDAAGIVEPPAGEQPDPSEKLTGLDNAIAHVLANCIKNPQAPGLINALTHLVANRGEHEAKAAERAERKAAHLAWKLEQHSSHEHGPSFGS